MSTYDAQAALVRALKRAGMEHVEFPDDDPGHVYARKAGATETLRYKLSPDAQRFLAGEFPTLPAGGLGLWLVAPSKGDD